MSTTAGAPIQTAIEEKLRSALSGITHMEVLNESGGHNVPRGSETHFKVVVVSGEFEGVLPLQRHRRVNEILQAELDNGVHALSIVAKTPKQWEKKGVVDPSPPCHGGSRR